MILMLLLASSISNLIVIWKAGGWTTYLIYNADFYTNAGSVVSKSKSDFFLHSFASKSVKIKCVNHKIAQPCLA